MDNKSQEHTLLSNLEHKIDVLGYSSCLLSVNAMSISLAVDTCRTTKYFEALLREWKQCLPLGDAFDVDFFEWSQKMRSMTEKVRYAYSLNGVTLNQYDPDADCIHAFKNMQDSIGPLEDKMIPLQAFSSMEVDLILVCTLNDLADALMSIFEFLSSPTEEQILNSFLQWKACYMANYHEGCVRMYNKWKIRFTSRTLKKNINERIMQEIITLKTIFPNEDEFDMVFDTEQMTLDIEGVSRFLFTNTDRFGVSYIGTPPTFSKELLSLFYNIDMWYMMQADLQPKKKPSEKVIPAADELEKKVQAHLALISHLASEQWEKHLSSLWKSILTTFHREIAKAGSREKFKEFSKKTLYCIIGHLRLKGVYKPEVAVMKLAKTLEGENNGMRKYLNNGLLELDETLSERLRLFVDQEMHKLAPEIG